MTTAEIEAIREQRKIEINNLFATMMEDFDFSINNELSDKYTTYWSSNSGNTDIVIAMEFDSNDVRSLFFGCKYRFEENEGWETEPYFTLNPDGLNHTCMINVMRAAIQSALSQKEIINPPKRPQTEA